MDIQDNNLGVLSKCHGKLSIRYRINPINQHAMRLAGPSNNRVHYHAWSFIVQQIFSRFYVGVRIIRPCPDFQRQWLGLERHSVWAGCLMLGELVSWWGGRRGCWAFEKVMPLADWQGSTSKFRPWTGDQRVENRGRNTRSCDLCKVIITLVTTTPLFRVGDSWGSYFIQCCGIITVSMAILWLCGE